MLKSAVELLHLAMYHEKVAKELRRQAGGAEEYSRFEPDVRLVFSATEKCYCGVGLAYDQVQDPQWTCSSILLGTAKDGKHRKDMPHSLHNFAVENGTTTRPKC